MKTIKARFDATGGKAIGAYNLAGKIPVGAIIKDITIKVVTTFTSATDAATIAVATQAAGDVVTAIAISDATNVWDAGLRGGKPGSPVLGVNAASGDTAIEFAAVKAASLVSVATTSKPIVVTVAVEALTAGVMDIFVSYVV